MRFAVGASAALVCLLLGLPALPQSAPAYDPKEPYPAYTAPRLAIGQPDIQGFWSNATLTPKSRLATFGDRLVYTEEEAAAIEAERAEKAAASARPVDTIPLERPLDPGEAYNDYWEDPGDRVMRVNGQPRTSIITTANGRPPEARPGAIAAQTAHQPDLAKSRSGAYDNPESRSLSERCLISSGRNVGPPMFSNAYSNNNYQIVQSPTAIVILTEMIHDARIIRLNASHRTDGVRPYFGDSVGRWDGDTLVVETTSIPRAQAYMGAWKSLKVTERFRRVAADRLLYTFEIEDKSIWDETWGGEYEFTSLKGQRIHEYACHEGNYSTLGILRAARAQDSRSANEAAASTSAQTNDPAGSRPIAALIE